MLQKNILKETPRLNKKLSYATEHQLENAPISDV